MTEKFSKTIKAVTLPGGKPLVDEEEKEKSEDSSPDN